MVDFKKRLASKQAEKPTDPVELYETLERAHDQVMFKRDVQRFTIPLFGD
ncbi:MAG TPA: hypothetical protein VJX30_07810 [Terriglobales bacterium]|nr:hypothetical protein [Candidatus Acidoferrum sp.]HKN70918.1 hypothetical protein [Terriglobales bacterium]